MAASALPTTSTIFPAVNPGESTMYKRHFSVIEVLVVVAIIAILATMGLPALRDARERALMNKALSGCKALELAISQYESTYGVLPINVNYSDKNTLLGPPGTYATAYTTMIEYLSCTGDKSNARGIRFLEVDTASTYQDPWGRNYNVILNTKYDGQITFRPIYNADPDTQIYVKDFAIFPLSDENEKKETVYRIAVIWSMGPDMSDSSKRVTSWQR